MVSRDTLLGSEVCMGGLCGAWLCGEWHCPSLHRPRPCSWRLVRSGRRGPIHYFDLRLRLFELRNSQPQSVLRFCVFGGQGFFGLTKKAKNRVGCRCGLYVDLTWLVVCTSLLCPSDKIGPRPSPKIRRSTHINFCLLFSISTTTTTSYYYYCYY